MYLIDTSVWIDYLKNKSNSAVQYFTNILENKHPFGLTSIIYQEILQGANSIQDFEKLHLYLNTQRFFHPKDPILTYQAAARLYFDCRKQGITIRSSIDCLIAEIAIEHDLILVHSDIDYRHIQRVRDKLKLAGSDLKFNS